MRWSGRCTGILHAKCHRLALSDDAEARRGEEHDAAIAFVGMAGDQSMHGCGKPQRSRVTRNVVHAPVRHQDSAGDAIGRNIGERGAQRREQPGALGLAVRLARLHHPGLQPGNAREPLRQRRAHGFGLRQPIAKSLARAFVDDYDRDGGQRLAILAGE